MQPTIRTMKKLLMSVSLASMAMASSQANTLSYSASTVPDPDITNWSKTVNLTQFDPSLGSLNSITLEIEGHILGSIRVESLDAAPSTVTSTLKALITATPPAPSANL